MGRIAKVLSFLRITKNDAKQTDVKVDPGNGANLTAQCFAPTGDDSQPLPDDYVLMSSIPRTGGAAVVGFVDPTSEPVAAAGEVRRYARDSAGVTVAQQWLKADGTALTSNDNGSITLLPDGTIVLTTPHGSSTFNPDGSVDFSNGAKLDETGDYISATGISLNKHTHIGNLGSPTSPPTP